MDFFVVSHAERIIYEQKDMTRDKEYPICWNGTADNNPVKLLLLGEKSSAQYKFEDIFDIDITAKVMRLVNQVTNMNFAAGFTKEPGMRNWYMDVEMFMPQHTEGIAASIITVNCYEFAEEQEIDITPTQNCEQYH